jgi:hypothetical protein
MSTSEHKESRGSAYYSRYDLRVPKMSSSKEEEEKKARYGFRFSENICEIEI